MAQHEYQNYNGPIAPSYGGIGLKYGLISGIIGLVATIAIYMFNPEILFSAWVLQAILFGLLIVLMIMAALEYRRENDGVISYAQALIVMFITFGASMLISTLALYVLVQFIDPDLQQVQMETAIDTTVSMLEQFDTPADTIEQAVADIEAQGGQMSLGQVLFGYFFQLIFGLLIAAILALFVKRNKPVGQITTEIDGPGYNPDSQSPYRKDD